MLAQSLRTRRTATTRSLQTPLVLWHLLSLDAPTIATLWTWFLARANHIHLPAASLAAMFLAVWTLYAADRLLDARLLNDNPLEASTLEPRHLFHHRYRTAFLIAITAASALLAAILPSLYPPAMRLYLILATLLSAYFILIHVALTTHRLPKELAVGIFFAAATFIPTIARNPALRLPLLPSALLFANLASLNCLFIYAWEHEPNTTHPNPAHPDPAHPDPADPDPAHPDSSDPDPTHPDSSDPDHLHRDTAHPTTTFALRYKSLLLATVAITGATLALLQRTAPWQIPTACTLAALLLLILHALRHKIPATPLRAAADLALATPLLLMPLLR